MIHTGYPYSYVFTTTDKGTNAYNHAGVSSGCLPWTIMLATTVFSNSVVANSSSARM